MTTDITELAQREKFEAWAEEAGALPWGILKKHRNQDGSYPGPHYTYMWKAWQAASAELVEALEKAQQRIVELDRKNCELDSLTQRWAVERAENADRIAELESSTVKLPDDAEHDIMAPVAAYLSEKFKWDGRAVRWDGRNEYDALADRVKYALRMVIRRAAGIKVETE